MKTKFTLYKLETNYRCPSKICEAAQKLITFNIDRFPKKTLAANPGGEISVHRCQTPAAEMSRVAMELQRYTHEQLAETAILCRTNRIVEEFSTFLAGVGIPVKTRKPVANPPDWKKAKMFLTVLANPWCDVAVERYVALRDGEPAAAKLRQQAAMEMRPACNLAFGSNEVSAFMNPEHALTRMAMQGLSPESRSRIEAAAAELAAGWTVPDLILALNAGEELAREEGHGVTVCTGHHFKGREANVVFIVGFEEGLFPMLRKDSDLSEELRLAYVCVTRARERLVISYCQSRPKPFGQGMVECTPSRFIGMMGLTAE
jgi:superfamily I DNA/RNA helicase